MRRVMCIIGASGGIGAAAAKALAKNHTVMIGYCNNESAANRLASQLREDGEEASAYRVDVTDAACVDNFFAFAHNRYGHIDGVVNCAGSSLYALATETTDTQWQQLFDVNVTGTFRVCRSVLPYMIQQQNGVIINISSIWGMTGASYETAYSASKAAVIGFTKALAKEVAPSGITVNCIAPGYIETEMNCSLTTAEQAAFIAETPLGKAGLPEDVARAVVYLAADTFTTGQVLSPNGGAVI